MFRKRSSNISTLAKVCAYLAAMLFAGLLIAWLGPIIVVAALLAVVLVIFSHHIEYAWYGLLALSLTPHWVIRLENFWYLFSGYPQLLSIEAPVVDFWAVFSFIALLGYGLRRYLAGKDKPIMLPMLGWYALFMLSAVLSLVNIESITEVPTAVHFIARFLLLFYLGYFIVGVNAMKKSRVLEVSLKILAAVGLLAAVQGFLGLITLQWTGGVLPRAVPISLFGWMPFGDQHVFLAEAITTTIPVWFYLWHTEIKKKTKQWLMAGIIFISLIGLFTFSRAGWITFIILGSLFLAMQRKFHLWHFIKEHLWIIVAAFMLVLTFVAFMLTTTDVYTSTAARWMLTEMSLILFFVHPMLGQGAGMFPTRASEMLVFQMEIGGQQDAHGVMQKLLAEQGLFGLLTFGLLIVAILAPIVLRYAKAKKHAHHDKLLLAVMLIVAPMTFQLFNTHMYSSKVWAPLAVAFALGMHAKAYKRYEPDS
ncbi:MAG: hypothetical protein HOE53_03640 [Candidatus Magasanikbacteria bacterium]|nr:hypothetical protein [Candidatus Magasanikbacteria bacterium]